MKLKENKKGQALENFGTVAIGIATFTIVIVVAFLVMSQTKTIGYGLVDATSYDNQTNTVTSNSFTVGGCIDDEDLSVTHLFNTTSPGAGINNVTNYSISSNSITIDASVNVGATANMTYSCRLKDNAYNSTETLQEATDDIPGWVPLIVIVLIGGIILLLIQRFRG